MSGQPRIYHSLAVAIAAMGMVNLTMGIAFPLTGLILAQQGVEPSMIGLSAAAQALPVFFITPFAPRLLARFGPVNIMLTGLLVAGIAFTGMGFYPNLYAWFVLRALLGSAGSLLWAISEAWINALAPEARRGRIIGVYGASAAAGFALGPVLLVLIGTNVTPFYVGAAMMFAACIVVGLADRTPHAFAVEASISGVWRLLLIVPAAILVNFFFAAASESLTTFFPLYAMHFHMHEHASLMLITIAAIGAIIAQPLLGALADKIDCLGLLTLTVVATIVGYLLLPLTLPNFIATGIVLFIVVGLANGIFTLGMILLGERTQGTDLAGASAFTTAMWGSGALVGAPFSGMAMQLWKPQGLIVAIITIFAVYLPFPLIAWIREHRH